MGDTGPGGLDSLSVEEREEEISSIRRMYDTFGETAFRTVRRSHFSEGYTRGYKLLADLLRERVFHADTFRIDPVAGVEGFLREYFVRRGWSMPDVSSRGDTVFLGTGAEAFCITEEAEKKAPGCHRDVCNIYCRAFAQGLVSVLEDAFPGMVLNFHNVSSRRDGKGSDCVEAFQVKWY